MEISQLENWNHIFCRKVTLLTGLKSMCEAISVGSCVSSSMRSMRPTLITKYYLLKGHYPYSEKWTSFLKFMWKPLHEVCNILSSYSDTSYSKGGMNQMWILEDSEDLLEYIQLRPLSLCNIIKTFDFSTLYTIIPHSKPTDRYEELIQLCFKTGYNYWLTYLSLN